MYKFPFEKLEVWRLSTDFALKIYSLTNKFPDSEKFGLVSQLRRASVSVPTNLAEGESRLSIKEKMRFFQIAYSSMMEVLSLLILSNSLDYISQESMNNLRRDIELNANKINALYKYHKSRC